MSTAAKKASGLGEGVFYAFGDYTSFSKRFLIIVIDLAVLIAIWWAIAIVLWTTGMEGPELWVFNLWVTLSWAYLTVIEASSLGTLGFFLTRAKVVTIKGQRPSIFRMTFRLLLWLIGPFNLLFDLIWLAGDPRKQALRDKLAGTYVIRKDASPAGVGTIRLANLMVLGLNLDFAEVKESVPTMAR